MESLVEELRESQSEYDGFKSSLSVEERQLAAALEQRLERVQNARARLSDERHKSELSLRMCSLKHVMSSISSASVKYLSVETYDRINRMQDELSEFRLIVQTNANEITAYDNQIQV